MRQLELFDRLTNFQGMKCKHMLLRKEVQKSSHWKVKMHSQMPLEEPELKLDLKC